MLSRTLPISAVGCSYKSSGATANADPATAIEASGAALGLKITSDEHVLGFIQFDLSPSLRRFGIQLRVR